MTIVSLTPVDLSIAATLILFLGLLSWRMNLGLAGQLFVAAARTVIQLSLIGFVLKYLFENVHVGLLSLLVFLMLLAAGREVMSRQKRKFKGTWGFGVGTVSIFASSFCITFMALTVIIRIDPWYTPQYAVPLLGMVIGNTMTGIAIGLDRLTQVVWEQRSIVESRLMLGQNWSEAVSDIRKESVRSGLIPIINSMAATGIVSLPGMMTGQILGGNPPQEAVKYQILIMFLIAGGTGFGTVIAVWAGSRRLFDKRERLRLDRLIG